MVGAQRAGGVVEVLVVVAQVRLPHGGDVLVHVDLLAQRHHQEDPCNEREGMKDSGNIFETVVFEVGLEAGRQARLQIRKYDILLSNHDSDWMQQWSE